MPDIRFYYEGDDDKAALQALKVGGLLPAGEIAPRSKQHPGKEGLVQEVAPFVRPVDGVAGPAVILIDFDDLNSEQVAAWFQKALAVHLPKEPPTTLERQNTEKPRIALFHLSGAGRTGRVVLVPVGLPDDPVIATDYAIDRYAIDDYLLRLVRDAAAYKAMTDFSEISQETALGKLMEFVKLLRNNNIPIRNSKRFLHLIRAITSFRPSSAVFVERLVGKAIAGAGKDHVRALLQPLLADLAAAADILNPPATRPP
jgi:hypothetical protein